MAEKDLQQIWQLVKDLLHEHDCVIVPGFGGFVGNREPARIDQVSHLITPPSKRIVFNQNLKNNDGLLANRIAEKLQLSYTEALKMAEELANQVKHILQETKHYEISQFGHFRLNADANYVFLPDKYNTYLPSSFGLAPIQAEPVASRTARIGKSRVFKDRKELRKANSKKNVWPKVLVAVLVMMLGINAWIFLQDNNLSDLRLGNNEMNLSSWFDSAFNDSNRTTELQPDLSAPVNEPTEVLPPAPATVDTTIQTAEETQPTEQVSEPEPAATTTQTDIDYYSHAEHIALARQQWVFPPMIPVAQPTEVTATEVTPTIEPTEEVTDPGNEPSTKKMPANKLAGKSAATDSVYFVIGGVFCKERNAVKYFNQLKEKGYHPELLINNQINCQRVSYAKFPSRKEAELLLMTIKTSENPGAWILTQRRNK